MLFATEYLVVDIFTMFLNPANDTWELPDEDNVDWEDEARKEWPTFKVTQTDLCPLAKAVFDFPGGHRTVHIPKNNLKCLHEIYKNWDKRESSYTFSM